MRQSCSGLAQKSGPGHGRSGARSKALVNASPACCARADIVIKVNNTTSAKRFIVVSGTEFT
jgi:hypothetical protein